MSQHIPQPAPAFQIEALQEELTAAQSNRLFLISCLKEMKHEAESEIGRLNGVFSQILGMLPDDEARQAAQQLLRGEQVGETPAD